MNITKYASTITERYDQALAGYQLIHEEGEVKIYIVYKVDGKIEIVRLFPNRYTGDLDISIEHKIMDIDHTLIPLTDLMQVIETVVNTLKGVV